MGVIQRVVKPRTKKAKRALLAKEPKTVEDAKTALFIRGPKASDTVMTALRDLHALKKPHVAPEFYGRKPKGDDQGVRPFEDSSKVEHFCSKQGSSLFMVGSHSKKRPHNLVLGRIFDGRVLDMVEFGLDQETFMPLASFAGDKVALGTKPCLAFSGSTFESDLTGQRVRNLLCDFFVGGKAENVRLAGIEHLIQFTAVPWNKQQHPLGNDCALDRVLVRSYRIARNGSGGNSAARVELVEIGPRMDLKLRRTHLASDDHFKSACKQPKFAAKVRKVKNVETDALGNTLGRVHIPPQKIGTIQTRKMKGLKETPEEKKLKQLEALKGKREEEESLRKAKVEAVFASD